LQANGGRPLQGPKDLDRIFKKRPDLIQEAVEFVDRYEGDFDFGVFSPPPNRKKKKRRK
jgi:hypothetical protein